MNNHCHPCQITPQGAAAGPSHATKAYMGAPGSGSMRENGPQALTEGDRKQNTPDHVCVCANMRDSP